MTRKMILSLAIALLAMALSCGVQANSLVNGEMGAPFNAIAGDPAGGSIPQAWTEYGTQFATITRGQSTTNSPFTGSFADNSSSFYMNDTATTVGVPNTGMIQAYSTPPVMTGTWSFDFMTSSMPAGIAGGQFGIQLADTNWQLTMLRFNINDANGYLKWYSTSANQGNILQIQSGTWYHVDSFFDVFTHTVTGAVTPFGGSAVAFSGLMTVPTTQPDDTNGIMIRDRTNGVSGELYVDNMSVTAVPEPTSVLALASGFIGLAGFSIRRRRA